jgi:hypothetical protein
MGADIDGSIYFYNPSLPACTVILVLYFIPAILLSWLTCARYKSWYFICVPIGAWIEVAGYIVRAYSVKHVTNIVSPITIRDDKSD